MHTQKFAKAFVLSALFLAAATNAQAQNPGAVRSNARNQTSNQPVHLVPQRHAPPRRGKHHVSSAHPNPDPNLSPNLKQSPKTVGINANGFLVLPGVVGPRGVGIGLDNTIPGGGFSQPAAVGIKRPAPLAPQTPAQTSRPVAADRPSPKFVKNPFFVDDEPTGESTITKDKVANPFYVRKRADTGRSLEQKIAPNIEPRSIKPSSNSQDSAIRFEDLQATAFYAADCARSIASFVFDR